MDQGIQNLCRRLEQGDALSVAGLGDSLTFGWVVREGFFDRFVDGLEDAFPTAAIERINLGVPGATARDGLHQVDGLLGRRPDLVVVQFGLNDCYSGESLEAFGVAMGVIAARLQEGGAQVVLATSCPVLDPEAAEAVAAYYERIAALGRSLSVPVARLDLHWQQVTRTLTSPRNIFTADGVHPNDRGHQILAQGLLRLFDVEAAAPGEVSTRAGA